jgi:hypothetical protein
MSDIEWQRGHGGAAPDSADAQGPRQDLRSRVVDLRSRGASYAEIAQTLGVTRSAVAGQLHRHKYGRPTIVDRSYGPWGRKAPSIKASTSRLGGIGRKRGAS